MLAAVASGPTPGAWSRWTPGPCAGCGTSCAVAILVPPGPFGDRVRCLSDDLGILGSDKCFEMRVKSAAVCRSAMKDRPRRTAHEFRGERPRFISFTPPHRPLETNRLSDCSGQQPSIPANFPGTGVSPLRWLAAALVLLPLAVRSRARKQGRCHGLVTEDRRRRVCFCLASSVFSAVRRGLVFSAGAFGPAHRRCPSPTPLSFARPGFSGFGRNCLDPATE